VLSQVPDHPFAHLLLGRIQIHSKRALQGIAECERALALDRNLAAAHTVIGVAKFYIGRAEENEGHINEALRLSPRDSLAHLWMAVAGASKVFLGRDEEGGAWLLRALETNRNYAPAHLALAHLGRLVDAQAATQAGLALDPNFTISRHYADSSDNPTYLAQRPSLWLANSHLAREDSRTIRKLGFSAHIAAERVVAARTGAILSVHHTIFSGVSHRDGMYFDFVLWKLIS
jgi:tetratricopeptide (TPR) repeat protein